MRVYNMVCRLLKNKRKKFRENYCKILNIMLQYKWS